MTDEQLLREALKALEACMNYRHLSNPRVRRERIAQAETLSYAAITKLEERLLQE